MDKIESLGWSQADYARKTGRHKRLISHYCNNERVMQPEDIHAACLIFGCDESELHEWIINENFLSDEQVAD